MSGVRVLCAADLHLGRRPAGLPASGSSGEGVSSADGWFELVEWAVREEVDLVALAGDVVDRLNRSFEAYGPLQRGTRALGAAGIPVVAVAGNHDHDTLRPMAEEVGAGQWTVLGAGGRWERWTLRGSGGRARLHVDGWSFPRTHWPEDPAASYDRPSPDGTGGVPVLGLLHADLDQPDSVYAPVTTAGLRAHPVDVWVLGHIHRPRLDDAPGVAPIIYPGSLQGLTAGETGPHGAWLVEVHGSRPPATRSVPLAAARYETVDVDVDGAGDEPALQAVVRRALDRRLAQVLDGAIGPLRSVHCRVRLTGRTSLHGRLDAVLAALADLVIEREGVRLTVDPRVRVHTLPALDLKALARGSDAPGLLARLLLESDEVDRRGLLEQAAALADEVAGRAHYATAGLEALDLSPDSSRVRDGVRRQAARLLDALLAQEPVR